MPQDVAKTGHTLQSLAQRGRYHSRFAPSCKTRSMCFRDLMQSSRPDVKVTLNGILYGEWQTIGGNVTRVLVL